jgi:hypothetical protein
MGAKGVLAAAAVLAIVASSEAKAFQCPEHIAEAEDAIADVVSDMATMEGEMSADKKALVHALLDDAKSALDSAKHSHGDPQSAFDHARAIAKAKQALGFAQGADILHFHYMMKGG